MRSAALIVLGFFFALVALPTARADEEPAAGGTEPAAEETSPIDPADATEAEAPTPQDAQMQIKQFVEAKLSSGEINRNDSNWRTRLPKFPAVAFGPDENYSWNLQTSLGAIKIKLMPQVAPQHTANFVYLTELGFFDGLIFHRVIREFMAQGGCPLGAGYGNPGYSFAGEFSPSVRHNRPGLLSMANAGPNTDGSQFFITFRETPHLDGKHTIFGEVVEGQDVVRKIEQRGSADGSGRTSERIAIEKAWISQG
jgi:peptidyl-prolyl cis-trans isomerase B (cyclophilin B)